MTRARRLAAAPSLTETVVEALANLAAHRLRSSLALLGILIGTASIVAMLAIGFMAQRETLKLFSHLGVDMLQVRALPAGSDTPHLDRAAVEGLPAGDAEVLSAVPLAVDRASVAADGPAANVGVAAVTPGIVRAAGLRVDAGRFLGSIDDDQRAAVVGAAAAASLSAPGAPLRVGSRLRLRGYGFTVVGVLAPVPFTALDPLDFNGAVLIPLAGAGRVLDQAQPGVAMLRLAPQADVKAASARVVARLAAPGANLQVESAQELIRGVNAQKAIHSRLLTAIGAISLVVGGIGVMNVMLMGVMERRREIGLRAAVGATPGDLQRMFLVEAATLAFVGGVAGLAAGLLAAFAVAASSGWSFATPLYVPVLGPGLAALVGVLFGFFPARQASRLDPIEALRSE